MAYVPGYSPPAGWMGLPPEDAPEVRQLMSIPPGSIVRIPNWRGALVTVQVYEVVIDTEQVTVDGYKYPGGDRFAITRSRPYGAVLKEV